MTEPHGRDTLYATLHQPLDDFTFDDRVAAIFPDMIRRSVPGYGAIIGLLGLMAGEYAQPRSQIYDLGCSLGAATLAMRRRIPHPGCRIIAVDNATSMVERCRENMEADAAPTPVEVVHADIRDIPIERASVVVMNFTLQFIAPEERLPLLRRVCAGMLPGGALVLAEKLAFPDAEEQAFQERMHLAFKRANGYSELEISQKRTALEKVLIPDSAQQHEARLQAAGFSRVYRWFQAFNFAAFLALK